MIEQDLKIIEDQLNVCLSLNIPTPNFQEILKFYEYQFFLESPPIVEIRNAPIHDPTEAHYGQEPSKVLNPAAHEDKSILEESKLDTHLISSQSLITSSSTPVGASARLVSTLNRKQIENEIKKIMFTSCALEEIHQERLFSLPAGARYALSLLKNMEDKEFYVGVIPRKEVIWCFRIFLQFTGKHFLITMKMPGG